MAIKERVKKVRQKIPKLKQKLKEKRKKESSYFYWYFLRLILPVIVIVTFLTSKQDYAELLFIFAMVISIVNFRIQKKSSQYRQLHSIVDACADRSLITILTALLVYQGIMAWWVLVVFLVKDIVFILAGLINLKKNRSTVFKPMTVSQVTLCIQALAILAAMENYQVMLASQIAVAMTIFNLVFSYFKPEFQMVKKDPTKQLSFRKLMKLADFFTLANVILGLLAITLAINDLVIPAAAVLILAVFFDFLDGKIARMTKTSNEFGKQLDSLADTVSFGVAPTIIGFSLIESRIAFLGFSIFLACGVLRLAKFNIIEEKGVYIGMPITIAGLIVAILVLAQVPEKTLPYIFASLGALMIAPVQMKKKL